MENLPQKPAKPGQLSLFDEEDLRTLIEETRATVATTVIAALTMLYWWIGKRMNGMSSRAIEPSTAPRLSPQWGDNWQRSSGEGFSEKSLRHMIRFAEVFISR